MNEEHLDELIEQHLNGTLGDAERRQLEERLLRSAADRLRFWQLAEVHALIHEVAQQRASTVTESEAPINEARAKSKVGKSRWHLFDWSPLAAAAAGLLIGIFGATAAWAYASPTLPSLIRQVLAVANAAFEENVPPLPNGVPIRFGIWSGDYAEIVGPHQGITPKEGQRMFRFLRSDSSDPASRGTIFNGNIYQVVDIHAYRQAIADGKAVADWSAWFNCVPESSAKKSQFVASVWAFAGDPSILTRNWSEKLYQEIAYSSWRITSDDDPATWQRIAGTMAVPPEANYLVVELKVIPGDPHPEEGAVSFIGHYADDVQLSLGTTSGAAPDAGSLPKR